MEPWRTVGCPVAGQDLNLRPLGYEPTGSVAIRTEGLAGRIFERHPLLSPPCRNPTANRTELGMPAGQDGKVTAAMHAGAIHRI